jgi:hypothetical protein
MNAQYGNRTSDGPTASRCGWPRCRHKPRRKRWGSPRGTPARACAQVRMRGVRGVPFRPHPHSAPIPHQPVAQSQPARTHAHSRMTPVPGTHPCFHARRPTHARPSTTPHPHQHASHAPACTPFTSMHARGPRPKRSSTHLNVRVAVGRARPAVGHAAPRLVLRGVLQDVGAAVPAAAHPVQGWKPGK